MADLTGKIARDGLRARVNNQLLDTVDVFYADRISGEFNLNLRPQGGFSGTISLFRKEVDDDDSTYSLVRNFTETELAIAEAYIDNLAGVTDLAIGLSALTAGTVILDLYAEQYNH